MSRRRTVAALALSLPLMLSLAACNPGMAARSRPHPRPGALAAAPFPYMIDIPAGSFEMGAGPGADVQQGNPRHRVTLPAFRIAATETTFAQYDRFARATGRALPQDEGRGRGAQPVVNVDRADMLAYIAWLNQHSGQTGFRLPSEAEWEYAARAGTTTHYYWGDDQDPRYANTAGTSGADTFMDSAPVASFLPNAWGLYDTAGNAWEEVEDCRHGDFTGAPTDGSAWMEPGCYSFMARGGDYDSIHRGMMVTARAAAGGQFAGMSLGFRVAQDVPHPPGRR